MQVAAVIPTYNEAENLPRLLSALFSLPLDLSVLVIDDNSPDGTGELAEQLRAVYPALHVLRRPSKQGLRLAYLSGFRHVLQWDTEAIAQMDADLSHDPAVLPRMFEALQSCEVVLGSRYVAGGSVDVRWPLWRRWLSRFGNLYARTILSLPLRDVTTGYRLWKKEALQKMPLERIQSNGYIFLVEMAYLAYRMGYRFSEVPIYFSERKWGKSKMSLGIQIEAAIRVWQVRIAYRDIQAHS
uniref:Dolichyl-phosphate beta-D-mannosyltransferase n=1 Tax=uncultured Chloroflexota bacterium TaxID=166587 RepID=H5SDY9_9CHLR|nr:dolichyl-phosphate beta-D-mannosyltransferase [uncultured Chloroflexota bacterium]